MYHSVCISFRHITSCDVFAQAMVGEPLAAVRCVALRCLGRVLEGVDSLPPSDAKIFNECAAASAISDCQTKLAECLAL